MTESGQGNEHRVFKVRKDDGSEWDLRYTSKGVRWVPLEAPESEPTDLSRGHSTFATVPVSVPATIAAMTDTASHLAQVWEMRQQRLLQSAYYEDRRLQWLDEMIGRWGAIHESSDGLDLLVSDYLAREATETLQALVNNRKWALPQSALHDLALILDVFRASREQLLRQFEELSSSRGDTLTALIQVELPGRTLNMAFIRQVAADPALEWERLVGLKDTARFDVDLQHLLRSTEAFYGRLFTSTEIAKVQESAPTGLPDMVRQLMDDVVAALPNPVDIDWKGDAGQRRDMFRELLLLPAEVARVRMLTFAWLTVSGIIEEVAQRDLIISLEGSRVQLALEAGPTYVAAEEADYQAPPAAAPNASETLPA